MLKLEKKKLRKLGHASKEQIIAFSNTFKKNFYYFKRIKLYRDQNEKPQNGLHSLPEITSISLAIGFALPEGVGKPLKDAKLRQVNETLGKLFGNKGPRMVSSLVKIGKNKHQSYGLIFKTKKEIEYFLTRLYFDISNIEITKPFKSETEHNLKDSTSIITWDLPPSIFFSVQSCLESIYANSVEPEIIDSKFKLTLSVRFKNYCIGCEQTELLLHLKYFKTLETILYEQQKDKEDQENQEE